MNLICSHGGILFYEAELGFIELREEGTLRIRTIGHTQEEVLASPGRVAMVPLVFMV